MRRASILGVAAGLSLLWGCGGGGGGGGEDIRDFFGPSELPELVIEDVVVGDGDEVAAGDFATIHYVGMLSDGTVFESSRDTGIPYTFRVGTGQVITGLDQGILGMRVGGTRRLTIPPHLAYGSRAVGPIPPNSTLIFEIELLSLG